MSTISQDAYNSVTSSDVLNYVTDMKNIKRTVSRKLDPAKKKVKPKPKKMEIDTNQNIFDLTMPPAFGSPRFKAVSNKKEKLNQINDKEEKLMDEIIKKSTEG